MRGSKKKVLALQLAVNEIADRENSSRAVAIRNQAVEFLGHLTRHRQRGADLGYEAYQVDLGTSA